MASELCGDEGLAIGRELERIGGAHEAIIARTCVIDERIAAAVVSGGITNVLVLGAGLDARPFRLALPPLRWTEVDLPEASAWKQQRLGERRARDHVFIAGDLSSPIDRERVLAEVDARTLVVIEGVIVYLARPEAEALLRAIAARGGRVVADVGARTRVPRLQRSARAAETRGAPFRTQIDRAGAWFEELGFRVLADVSLLDWDAARSDARWQRPFASIFRPMIRDVARVIDAAPA